MRVGGVRSEVWGVLCMVQGFWSIVRFMDCGSWVQRFASVLAVDHDDCSVHSTGDRRGRVIERAGVCERGCVYVCVCVTESEREREEARGRESVCVLALLFVFVFVCVCACACVCIDVCMWVCQCIYTCIYMHIYICIVVCVYVSV